MTETTANPMAAQIAASRSMIETLVAKANEAAAKVRSVQNQSSAVSDLIKESDDPTVVKYREERDKAQALLAKWETEVTAYVKAQLLPKDESVDVEAETATHKEARAAAKALADALKIIGGEDAVKDLPEVNSLGRSGGTAGVTGIKRPRVERLRLKDAADDADKYAEVKQTKTENGVEKVTVSFSVLAQQIKSQYGHKIDANTIREHAEGVAGPYDTWANRNGEPFEFVVSVGEGDDRKHLSVEVTPQS